MAAGKKLTPKQKMFVAEYLVSLNATDAARKAGYSEKTAEIIGHENLRKPNIQAAIQVAQQERSEKLSLSAEWVLERFKLISDRCIQGEPVMDREGKPTGEWKFDSSGANKATEMIGKHLGMFVEKHELTGKDGGPIEVETLTPEERQARINELIQKRGS